MARNKIRASFIFLHLFLLVMFYWPALSGAADFYFEDITHFFEPNCKFIGQSLARGEFPLWNPLSYCGMPQVAVSSPGIFFPFNWLFAFLPFSPALALILISHQLLAGVAGYAYTRFLGLSRLAAFFAGSTICLSGYLFGAQSNYTLVCGVSWLCCSFLAFAYLTKVATFRKNICWTLISVLSVAMVIAAGRPEIFVPGFALLLLQTLLLSLNVEPKLTVSKEYLVAATRAFVIGLLFAMPAILPACEWIPWSRRSEGLFAGEVLLFSASWFDLLSMILLQPLGDLQQVNAPYGGLVTPMKWMPYLPSAYLGPAVATFALWGILAKNKRLAWLLLSVILLTLMVSAGSNLPGFSAVVESLNLFSLLRFPVKLLVFAVLAASILAALGIEEFLAGRARVFLPLMVFGLMVLAGVVLLGSGAHILLPFELEGPRIQGQRLLGQSLLLTGLIGAAINCVAAVLQKKVLYRRFVLGVIFAASVSALVLNALIGSSKFIAGSFFSQPSQLAQVLAQENKKSRLSIPSGRLMPFYIESFIRPKDLLWETDRQVMFPNSNYDFGVPSIYGFEGAMVGEYFYYLLNTFVKSSLSIPQNQAASFATKIQSKANGPEFGVKSDLPLYRFLQISACNYVTTQKHVKALDGKLFQLVREIVPLNLRLYRVKAAMSRVYLMKNFRVEKRDGVIDRMFFAEKSGFSPEQECLLEETPEFAEPGAVSSSSIEKLVLEDLSNTRIRILTQSAQSEILVLADQYYPGWKVMVDGAPQKILRANGFFRGVALSQGKHEVLFSYEPDSVRNAYLLVGCGILWLLLWIFQAWPRTSIES